MQEQNWIYLSKGGIDEYINLMAKGAKVAPVPIENWRYDDDMDSGLVLRGIMKHKIMKKCWQDKRPFRYMDTGYFGNRPYEKNPRGWKWYHRVVNNNLQHHEIIPRARDRWERLAIDIKPWRKNGRNIVIVMPDDKACQFYNTTALDWLRTIEQQLAAATDRPIHIRHRIADPDSRTRNQHTSFAATLMNDTFATVVFNSVAATESVVSGIPTFVTAPSNAALPVANTDLAQIDNPWYADRDMVQAWACHLAYGQFHISELEDGTALKILDQ